MALAQAAADRPWVSVVIAVIAAITALIGAAIAAVTAGIRQRRDLAHARSLTDVAELRAVLDEAARALARAATGMDEAGVRQAAGHAPSDSQVAALRAARDELAEYVRRIRIRLGPGAVLEAFESAMTAHARFVEVIVTESGEGGRASFDTAHDAYFVAAHELVGAALTAPPAPPARRRAPRA